MRTHSTTKKTLASRLLALSALMIAVVVLSGCYARGNEKKAAPQAAATVSAIPIDGAVIQPASLKEELEITGSLMANRQVDIVSELPRKIISIHVKEGAYVRTGQLLFEMDNADLLAQLEKLHQQEKLALLNEARLRDLIKHEAVIQQDYDQTFTNLKVLQAQIAELQVALAKTHIRAPFNGQIGILHIYPGAVVSVNTILANIQDNDIIKVDFRVPEKYANVITPGSEQTFTVASDARQYKARVTARGAELDQDTRTLLVRAITPNPGRVLLPGQSARLRLSLHSSDNAMMLSSQALIPSSQGYNVYLIKNNRVTLAAVEIGQRGPASVEIAHGLQNGDTVATSNLLRLTPGAAVQFVTLK